MSEKINNKAGKMEDALKRAFGERWKFYRDSYYKIFKLNIVLMAIIVLQTIIIFFLAAQDTPEPRYFTTDNNGNITEIFSANKALPDKVITDFVEEAVEYSYTYNFKNSEEIMTNAQEYFTDTAWKVYKKSSEQNLLPAIIDGNLLMQTSKLSAARIISKSTLKGRAVWTLEIDVVRTLIDRANSKSKPAKYQITVIRESENIRPRKLAILSLTEKV